ncbi:MAG: hypothetical protein HKN21_13065 [Candidatus Eisenbacteria bacterium]|uniref:PTS system mannose/fructose/sorbose family transporter subunit IID n=1 Tax=Eiseniibacteriota bacterium TaxID=2212470 RepID=A0A7Y2H342_UNCEI|nr:hypothetical protein [Candidatus Eisenbacteria bacterium]
MTLKTRLQLIGSLLGLQGAFSNQFRQGVGALLVLKSVQDEEVSEPEFIDQNLEFFNSHPAMAGPILGAVAGLQAEAKSSNLEKGRLLERAQKLKTALAAPFAAVGDALLWRDLRGGLGLLAVATCLLLQSLWALLAYFLVYNLIHLGLRLCGFFWGFGNPKAATRLLQAPGIQRLVRFSRQFGWIGVAAMSMTLLSSPTVLSTPGFSSTGFSSTGPGMIPVVLAFGIGFFWGHKGWIPFVLVISLGWVFTLLAG